MDEDNEFIQALEAELGVDKPTEDTTDTTAVVDKDEGAEDADKSSEAETESDDQAASEGEDSTGKGDKPDATKETTDAADESASSQDDTKAEDKDKKEEEPKFATKQDVVDAMREYNEDISERVDRVHTAREEVISKLHPEGIDTKIYDTNGNVIKTAQDIVDRHLLNPDTREEFSYEEAASWLLNAQQQQNKNIEELNKYAEEIAEKNVSLLESNQRVMGKWGEVLEAMPEKAKELADHYIATQLEFDQTKSYITRMGMSPEAFYDLVLAPYQQLGVALAEKAQLEEAAAQQAAKVNQSERNDSLPRQRGSAVTKSNTGDEFLDAFIDEINKA